jgi:phage terminase small subunit
MSTRLFEDKIREALDSRDGSLLVEFCEAYQSYVAAHCRAIECGVPITVPNYDDTTKK